MAFLNFYSTAAECGVGTDSTLAGSFDSNYCSSSVLIPNNQSGPFMDPGPGLRSNLWFHMEVFGDDTLGMTTTSADGYYFFIPTNSTYSFILNVADGAIRLESSLNFGISTLNAGSFIAIPWINTRVELDVHVELNPAGNNFCRLYVNGALVNSTFVPNSTAPMTNIRGLNWVLDDINGNLHLSQMIVSTEDTRGLKLCAMKPNAAGDNSAWTGDFNNAIEKDGTFLSSVTANQREDWNLEAYPGPATPTGIQLFQKTIAISGETGPQGIAPYLRIGSTNYDGATESTPILTKPIITAWPTNPATSLPWDSADLASLIAGVRSIT